ncbi:hypothetical protein QBC46DRAFT_301480 [Diplogelasinospora grovesii]|uniref:Protein required for cell viability n=1 Tax=Diplogelasinospora grovesii TaxID=303347 RepID=A0AAN6NI39_9PEZI|nr:hypothetical protein QBC46DRAFT_301480 [Diplogelasinospora grovesii]
MSQAEPEQQTRQKLMSSILELGGKAFNPASTSGGSQAQAKQEFDELIRSTKTMGLIAALNTLIRPGHAPEWLRPELIKILAQIPLRPDGVRATLEFVFAVHPSSTVKVSEAAEPQKKGANITPESLETATRLLCKAPASVTPRNWYSGIAPQLLGLLDRKDGPELEKAAAHIIGFGILGRKAFGAPGTAGWTYLAEPLINSINPPLELVDAANNAGEIIDLTKERVIVKPDELATALHRLASLLFSHPNPALFKQLTFPLLLPLWAIASWTDAKPAIAEKYCHFAGSLLRVALKLAPSPDFIQPIIKNLGYMGGKDLKKPEWMYNETAQGELQIISRKNLRHLPDETHRSRLLVGSDKVISILLNIILDAWSDAFISQLLVNLVTTLIAESGRRGRVAAFQENEPMDPIQGMLEIEILNAMMQKFPDKLANEPKLILDLVNQVLAASGTPNDDDDTTPVALSLLNMIITAPGFQKARVDAQVMQSIESSLDRLSNLPGNSDVSKTAMNLKLVLTYRDEVDEDTPASAPSGPTARQVEDRQTYNLAIQYITQADSPPPVRSEGLNMIANLIASQSPVLDIPGILVMMSSIMHENEDYINLRVIKIFTLLAGRHPKATVKELLDHYVDPKEMISSVDTRLRFGEALMQVIERLGETFTGELAQEVGEALMGVASRRTQRPKTEARQAREERARRQRQQEAEEAWGGEVPDLNDYEPLTEEEKKRNEILAKIVSGWEGKNGAEDVRIRASALSILGMAIQTNIMGLGTTVVRTAVDMCISILQLEQHDQIEKGILRGAAVVLIWTFIMELDKARQEGRQLGVGFGFQAQETILNLLKYVAATDEHGLVREHANDAVGVLEDWRMNELVPDAAKVAKQEEGGGLGNLAGLAVNPVLRDEGGTMPERPAGGRPIIEEVDD